MRGHTYGTRIYMYYNINGGMIHFKYNNFESQHLRQFLVMILRKHQFSDHNLSKKK